MFSRSKITVVAIASVKDYNERFDNWVKQFSSITPIVLVVTKKGADNKVLTETPFLKIIQYGGEFDFSTVRNFAKEYAKTDYIISLDMDEELCLSEKEADRILNGDFAGYKTTILNYDKNETLLGIHDSIRIFKKEYNWKYSVHEDISTDIYEREGQVATSSHIIKHFGYEDRDSEEYYKKLNRNLELAFKDDPLDPYVKKNTLRILKDMERWENDNLKGS